MGAGCSVIRPIIKRPITIVILGLDHAGKTTVAKVLEKTSIDFVAPTIGFAQYKIVHKNEKIKLYDLGGAKSFREAWRHYYDDPYVFIYVIDSSAPERFDENHEELKQVLQEDKVKNKPILILANKQDEVKEVDQNANLKLEQLVRDNHTLYRMELCTATLMSQNGKGSVMDPSIQKGFEWLVKTIYDNYDLLHKRVQHDVQRRNEAERKAREERQIMVKKIREEREKQEGEKENQEVDDPTDKGFVPIGQAIKNAEIKSTVS